MAFAFKEWQVVCDALESGEQSLILRKGGISEGKEGFQWLHEGFFLFPTRFHEQLEGVKGGRRLRDENSDESSVEIRLWARLLRRARLTDWEAVLALEPFHIWTESVIRERFEWGEEPGISVALLRVYRLPQPWHLPMRKSFGGCRSWLGLGPAPGEEEEALLHRPRGEPVLDDVLFESRTAEVGKLFDQAASSV